MIIDLELFLNVLIVIPSISEKIKFVFRKACSNFNETQNLPHQYFNLVDFHFRIHSNYLAMYWLKLIHNKKALISLKNHNYLHPSSVLLPILSHLVEFALSFQSH